MEKRNSHEKVYNYLLVRSVASSLITTDLERDLDNVPRSPMLRRFRKKKVV